MGNQIEKQYVQKVIDNLTGNFDKDLDYLLEERLKLLLEAEDTSEASYQLMNATFDLFAPSDNDEVSEDISTTLENMDESVMDYFAQEDYDKAFVLAMDLLNILDEVADRENTVSDVYYSFDDIFELDIYTELNGVKKNVILPAVNFADMYADCGRVLGEVGLFDRAGDCYAKARRWNPISAHIGLDYAELLIELEEYDHAERVIREITAVVYSEEDLMRVYILLGDCLKAKECYEAANIAYLKAFYMDEDSEQVAARLYYLMKAVKEWIPEPTEEQEEWYCKRFHIPEGVDDSIMELLFRKGRASMDDSDLERAFYYYSLLIELVDDDDVFDTWSELFKAIQAEMEEE